MPTCAFLKPVQPSKTLANFLANNTNLPILVWWIILKFKYLYEEQNLEIFRTPISSIHKLRSGAKYFTCFDPTQNTDLWFKDSYHLCNIFDKTNKSKLKGTLAHDKMIYDCLLTQMNFVLNWIHMVVLNAETKDYMKHFLETGLFNSLTRIYNDIYKPTTIKDPQYKKWCIEIVEDLKQVKDYIRCPCGWRKNPRNKCSYCHDFEQYFYNYDSYYDDNFTVLRSGKMIKKKEIVKKPIIIQNVYRLF